MNYQLNMQLVSGHSSNVRHSMLPQPFKPIGRMSINDQMNSYSTTLNEFYELLQQKQKNSDQKRSPL